jgi:hypothetical protein
LARFSGKAFSTTSGRLCFWAWTSAGCSSAGGVTPTPAFEKLMAASPMKSASVVTTSK